MTTDKIKAAAVAKTSFAVEQEAQPKILPPSRDFQEPFALCATPWVRWELEQAGSCVHSCTHFVGSLLSYTGIARLHGSTEWPYLSSNSSLRRET